MSLARRLTVALLVAALVLGVLLGVTIGLLLQVRASQEKVVGDLFRAVVLSDRAFVRVVDIETGIRGYALTGNASALDPLKQAQTPQAQAESKELRTLLTGETAILAKLDDAGAAAQKWYTGWAQPLITTVQQHGRGAVDPAEVQRGKQIFDGVRAKYDAYVNALLERRAEALARLKTRTNAMVGLMIGLAAAAAVAGVGLAVALRRWVTRPLAELGAEARTVRSGDLDHAVGVAGPPEIEALAHDVDAMRVGLVQQLAEVEQARTDLELAGERLRMQTEELQRSNRDLEQFAYVASHDLQEPLRKVASFCQLLERRYKGQLDERADQYIDFAVDGAKRMQQLINDLLAFSRVGRLSTSVGSVDLDASLASALRNLATSVEESGAQVTSDPLPTIEGDATLLTQLLQNLVGNAIKFRGDEPPKIHVSARRVDDDEWELACSDNGIGIEPQYAERIFVIFQRLHPRDEYAGTGIGLAMCKKIVEYHGGRIWLDPGSSTGTTIRWTLPELFRAGEAQLEVAAAG
jgi:signal transduction histidine kinase